MPHAEETNVLTTDSNVKSRATSRDEAAQEAAVTPHITFSPDATAPKEKSQSKGGALVPPSFKRGLSAFQTNSQHFDAGGGTNKADGTDEIDFIPLTTHGDKGTLASTPVPDSRLDSIFSPASKLKYLLENTDELVVCPGVYDGFSARIALSVGFQAMYMVRPPKKRSLELGTKRIYNRLDRRWNHRFKIGDGRPWCR